MASRSRLTGFLPRCKESEFDSSVLPSSFRWVRLCNLEFSFASRSPVEGSWVRLSFRSGLVYALPWGGRCESDVSSSLSSSKNSTSCLSGTQLVFISLSIVRRYNHPSDISENLEHMIMAFFEAILFSSILTLSPLWNRSFF